MLCRKVVLPSVDDSTICRRPLQTRSSCSRPDRIGIGVETDVGNDAGALAADGVQKLAVHAERHGESSLVRLTARPADRRGHAQMGGDQRLDDALVLDFGQSAAILNEIAGRNAGNDRQVARGCFAL